MECLGLRLDERLLLYTDTHIQLLILLSLVPRPPPFFCSLVFIQYNTWKRKSAKNGEGLGIPTTRMTSGGRMGGGVHIQITH